MCWLLDSFHNASFTRKTSANLTHILTLKPWQFRHGRDLQSTQSNLCFTKWKLHFKKRSSAWSYGQQDRISKKTKTWAQPPLTHTVYSPHLPDLSMLFSSPDSFAWPWALSYFSEVLVTFLDMCVSLAYVCYLPRMICKQYFIKNFKGLHKFGQLQLWIAWPSVSELTWQRTNSLSLAFLSML